MITETKGAQEWLDTMKIKHFGKDTECRPEGSFIHIFLKTGNDDPVTVILGLYCKDTGQGKVFSGPPSV